MKKNVVLGLLSLLSCIALVACVCIAVCYNFGNDGGDNLIHTHTLTLVGEKQASCAEEGNIAYYVCDGCGRFFLDEAGEIEITDKSSVVIFIPHTLTPVEGKEATCTQKGNTPYYTCGVCGKWFSDADGKSEITDKDSVSVGLQAHAFRNGKCEKCGTEHDCKYTPTVTPPTCIQQGFTTYTCECGASYTADYKDTVDHDYFNGKCRICGGEHDCKYTDAVTVPTCTERGLTTHTCDCGASYIDGYTDPTGHNYSATVTEQTCTEKGFITHTCVCGDSYIDGYTDALGHDYIDGECSRCGHFNYTVGLAYSLSDDGTYYICTGIGEATDTEIIIPSSYNGLPVTEIGRNAFIDCSQITSVTLHSGITLIDNYAFSDCANLREIIIPNSVEEIGICAFRGCKSLTEITLPDGLTKIGSGAFRECGFTELVVPDSVTSIGNYAFYGCSNLTEITIPAGVEALGSYTFTSCTKLEKINFKGTVAQWQAIPHTDWLYMSDCTVVCTDGEIKGGQITLR